ncbi:hypothetical protein L596_017465 [Steinernema carpocapsae]|uniref:BTB domain-containing protein n=1 Tax=Steinernema carpocapsae TaxID=34508 RepID=A0A4U5N1R3_STECR|nr:hypothetical protein L596_017465 [Steinernema carpocapsae]
MLRMLSANCIWYACVQLLKSMTRFEESFHPWSFHETIIVAEANLSELTSVSLKITMDRFNVIDLEAPEDNKNTATFSLDDAEIHFSKDILALHSPFFEEMLKENKETYKLANFDLASFRLVLLHMCAFPIDYTRFPLDEELFREVFDGRAIPVQCYETCC